MKSSMNIFRLALIAFGLLWAITLSGQMVYKITATPDSVAVMLDGQLVGHTPFEYKKGWKAGTVLDFELVKPGYQPEKFTLSMCFWGNKYSLMA